MESEATSQSDLDTAAQVAGANELHLADFLVVLSKRRRFVFFFSFCAAILASGIVLILPNQYTAITVILPPGQNSSSAALLSQLGGSGGLSAAAGASLGVKSPSELYLSLFRSRTVEDAVIQRFGLLARYHKKIASDARRAFEEHSKVALGSKDGLISVSVTDRDPNLASEIANGYVEAFRNLSANLAISEASQRRLFFQQQLLEAKENLTKADEALKGTQQSTGVLQIDSQTRSLIESAAAIRAEIVAKEVQLQGMRTYATDDNPEMLQAKQELTALQAQLGRLGGSDQDSGLIVPKGKVPEAELEYIRRIRDVKYYDTISELIARQLEMAKLDEARQGAVIQVVEAAIPPDTKSFPKRTIIVLISTVMGFFFACGWCIGAEWLRLIKKDPQDGRRVDALKSIFR
ncbi:MAG: Wzz/FepE/Etk N-terminal domain-containing protein [Terracidiphilus sp.]|jgi:uncharacterized protein involved in exopolysaccharide biosynthesis